MLAQCVLPLLELSRGEERLRAVRKQQEITASGAKGERVQGTAAAKG
jgi:hypothetical protein